MPKRGSARHSSSENRVESQRAHVLSEMRFRLEIVKTQRTAVVISILLALGAGHGVHAQDRNSAAATGFYGGVSMRDSATEGAGVILGPATSVWSRYVAPTADDSSPRALVFGGYRFRNDIAVEASFNSVDQYALARL